MSHPSEWKSLNSAYVTTVYIFPSLRMTYLVGFIYRDLHVGLIYHLLNYDVWVSDMFVWWKNVTVYTSPSDHGLPGSHHIG